MRWLLYLLIYLCMQIIAWIITPILPLFTENREGWLNNRTLYASGLRLVKWLSWFDTPDNSIDGDANHLNKYILYPTYLRNLIWLYRNSLYGFKWTILGYPISGPTLPKGIWQRRFEWWVFRFDFGWLIFPYIENPDTYKDQPKALFQFSIRLKNG